MEKTQQDRTGTVFEMHEEGRTAPEARLREPDRTRDRNLVAGPQGPDGGPAAPVLIAYGEMKQEVLDAQDAEFSKPGGEALAHPLEDGYRIAGPGPRRRSPGRCHDDMISGRGAGA